MAEDRPLPPSRARQVRAWRAGLRPRSRLVALAIGAGVGVLLAGQILGAPLADARALVSDLEQSEVEAAADALRRLVVGMVSLAGLWLAIVIAAGLLTRTVGPMSTVDQRRDGFAMPHDGIALVVVGAVAAGTAVALARGVVAGAARAPAASESGLVMLWRAWGVHGLLYVGALAAAVGGVVWWWRRRAIVASLHQTHAQARAESDGARGPTR